MVLVCVCVASFFAFLFVQVVLSRMGIVNGECPVDVFIDNADVGRSVTRLRFLAREAGEGGVEGRRGRKGGREAMREGGRS